MNRVIKFRAWDEHERRFIESWVMDNHGVYHNGREFEDYIPQLDLDLQQFTGLKDKYGKEIYEGDLVETAKGWVWKVEWGAERAAFFLIGRAPKGKLNGRGEQRMYISQSIKDATKSEIIGNIYENGELLKV